MPLLLSMTIIPFANLNSIFRGVFNGLDNVKTSSLSTLLEQIARIGFSVVLFVIFYDKDLVFTVTITIIAMTLGEIASVIYNLISIRKLLKNNPFIYLTKEEKINTKELNSMPFSSMQKYMDYYSNKINFCNIFVKSQALSLFMACFLCL